MQHECTLVTLIHKQRMFQCDTVKLYSVIFFLFRNLIYKFCKLICNDAIIQQYE